VAEGNVYTNDGYGDRTTGMGGNYVECSDIKSPGVRSISHYLSHLPYRVFSPGGPADCAPHTYYLVNNYDPAYDGQGGRIPLSKTPFLASPQSIPSIGDALSAKGVSWGYFGQGWNHGHLTKEYCSHCNPFQFETSVMSTDLRKNLQGYKDFRIRVEKGTLPSVSFVKPGNSVDGHPGYSSLSKFERFVEKTVALIRSHPGLYKNTAIFITFDEGGGYYDSGYIQPLWFFGDGTRVPLILISPFARRGFVDHTYYNHVSLIKFIEKNWHLGPLSKRSLDNLPNPNMPPFPEHPESLPPDRQRSFYIPQNRPSIGDLTNLFDFSEKN
jgi:phospholipase C